MLLMEYWKGWTVVDKWGTLDVAQSVVYLVGMKEGTSVQMRVGQKDIQLKDLLVAWWGMNLVGVMAV